MAIKTRNPRLSDLFETPKSSTYTVAGVTIFLTILMIFVVIRPSVSRILTQISENQKRQEVIDKLNQKFTNLQTLIQSEEKFQKELDFFDNEIFPDSRREDEFIANMSEGARILGVDMISVGVAEDTDSGNRELPENISTYYLTISIVGTAPKTESFVSFVELFPRTINITEIVTKKVDPKDVGENVSAEKTTKVDIKGVVYFWTDESSSNLSQQTP